MTVLVPFLDLRAAQASVQDDLDEVWRRSTRSARYIGGQAVSDFEVAWASFCGSAHAVGVANGTDAIELTLSALGLGPGDEVLIPANTFIATAEAVVAVGATPVFVDVDPETLLAGPEEFRAHLTTRTRALVAVHLFGQPADMTGICALAADADVVVVEDCAQAHGASWQGRGVGTFGRAGCFSFYPGKNLGALGDAGAVVTEDPGLAEAVRRLADHGRSATSRDEHEVMGRNSRLDALQAGFLSVKLARLPGWNDERRQLAGRYEEALAGHSLVRLVRTRDEADSVHHLQVVRVPHRDTVRDLLHRRGIETGVHYRHPCHAQPASATSRTRPLPVVEAAATEILSLPLYPGMPGTHVDHVVAELQRAVAAAQEEVR